MEAAIIVAIIAAIVPLGTLALQIFIFGKKANSDYVIELEKRIIVLEANMKTCEDARITLNQKNDILVQENLNLLKQIAASVVIKTTNDALDKNGGDTK